MTQTTRNDYPEIPEYHFTRFVLATQKKNAREAANAQQELRRLGFEVRHVTREVTP